MVRKYRVIRALHYTNVYKRGLASPRLPRASHNLKPPLVIVTGGITKYRYMTQEGLALSQLLGLPTTLVTTVALPGRLANYEVNLLLKAVLLHAMGGLGGEEV
jgi:hypothetical protein